MRPGCVAERLGRRGCICCRVDGPYVDRRRLLIDPGDFHAADLAAPIGLGRRFDLVQSLEVAEHLPAAKAEQFVDMLTTHGHCVMFSAAVPGQGAENHVNEQPAEYWRAIFGERGYGAVDFFSDRSTDCGAAMRSLSAFAG